MVVKFRESYSALAKKLLGSGLRAVQRAHVYQTLAQRLAPGFTISLAGPNDLAKIFGGEPPPDLKSNSTIFVARSRLSLIGYVLLVKHPQENYPYVGHWFYGLWVSPLWRRLGIGEALLQQVIEQAEAEKASALFCLVFEDNRAALNLYDKLGFHIAVLPALEKELADEIRTYGRRRVLLRKALSR